jgi:hypothetical protein
MSSLTSSGWADPPARRAGPGTGHYDGCCGYGPDPALAAPDRPLGALEGEWR